VKQLVSLLIKLLPEDQRDMVARWASITFAVYEVYVYFSGNISDEVLAYLVFVFIMMALPGTLYYRIAAKLSSKETHWHFTSLSITITYYAAVFNFP